MEVTIGNEGLVKTWQAEFSETRTVNWRDYDNCD